MRDPGPNSPKATGSHAEEAGREQELRARLDALKADLGEAIAEEKAGRAPKASSGDNASALAAGMRAASELVAGVLVGGGIGFVLDRTLGTKPWLLIIFLMLGMAAGLRNMYRLGMRKTAPRPPGTDGLDPR
ncbi:MAG: AtpZ/AtpI family protein [Rhabdaerophilum sp.]